MEESKFSSPLLDLPEKLVLEVLKHCDYPSIQSLRKVCQNLRDFIDETNVKCPNQKVSIKFGTDEISICLGDRFTITYRKVKASFWYPWRKQTCMVSTDRKNYTVKNKFTLTFFNDFDEILKQLGGPLENLEIILVDLKLLEKFQHYLRHQGTLIQTKSLKVQIFDSFIHHQAIILSMDPEHLRTLELVMNTTEATNDFETTVFVGHYWRAEQWGRLEELKSKGIKVLLHGHRLENILHLSKVDINLAIVETENIVEMKQNFLSSGSSKHWRITSRLLPFPEELVESLGQPYENEDNERHRWFYRVPGGSHILQIMVSGTLLELKFVERDEVPKNALVQSQH